MKRRNFLKLLGSTPLAGLFGCKSKPKDDIVVANNQDEVQQWKSLQFIDFEDQIMEVVQDKGLGDKMLVYCKHSVWSVWMEKEGEFVRKLEGYL